ncbi:hypothetical protein ACLOJK_036314 [Asimina triloba]
MEDAAEFLISFLCALRVVGFFAGGLCGPWRDGCCPGVRGPPPKPLWPPYPTARCYTGPSTGITEPLGGTSHVALSCGLGGDRSTSAMFSCANIFLI